MPTVRFQEDHGFEGEAPCPVIEPDIRERDRCPSIYQVLQMVDQVSGLRVPHVPAKRRPGDPAVLRADNRAALEVLNWKPVQSSLREIVESAWRWHSSHTSGEKSVLGGLLPREC